MKTNHLELYTDYLMINAAGYATATGLSTLMEGEVSHDQITRLGKITDSHGNNPKQSCFYVYLRRF